MKKILLASQYTAIVILGIIVFAGLLSEPAADSETWFLDFWGAKLIAALALAAAALVYKAIRKAEQP